MDDHPVPKQDRILSPKPTETESMAEVTPESTASGEQDQTSFTVIKEEQKEQDPRGSPDVLQTKPMQEGEVFPYDGSDNNKGVEDIAMSPLPFDREDPTTLMELPENLLSLPISACGPNDSSRRSNLPQI